MADFIIYNENSSIKFQKYKTEAFSLVVETLGPTV